MWYTRAFSETKPTFFFSKKSTKLICMQETLPGSMAMVIKHPNMYDSHNDKSAFHFGGIGQFADTISRLWIIS